jgi:5-methylcytosine-specific restriction endonuclease McrA
VFIERNCLNCSKIYSARKAEIKRGWGKFCSKSCSAKYTKNINKTIPEPNCTCAYCYTKFYKTKSKQKNSRTGIFFCCREHKDISQRVDGGIKDMFPSHYKDGSTSTRYRSIAFSNAEAKCAKCGYDEYIEVLEVHHIDRNRKNNDSNNLTILCPTCHDVEHFLSKTGKWRNRDSNAKLGVASSS